MQISCISNSDNVVIEMSRWHTIVYHRLLKPLLEGSVAMTWFMMYMEFYFVLRPFCFVVFGLLGFELDKWVIRFGFGSGHFGLGENLVPYFGCWVGFRFRSCLFGSIKCNSGL